MATTTQTAKPEDGLIIGTLALRTLSGDIRDRMMGQIRTLTNFDDRSMDEQQRVIDCLTEIGERTARESITLVHGRALPTLGMKVVSAQRKGKTMRVTLEAPYTKPGWLGFGDCEEIVAVQASPEAYFGERRPLHARPDQPNLDLEDEADAVFESGDINAEGMQDQALGEGEGALGPEAIRNGEMLEEGIQPLEPAAEAGDAAAQAMQAEALNGGGDQPSEAATAQDDPAKIDASDPAPRKRGRRTAEERVAARLAEASQEPTPKRGRRARETVTA